jgi:hypothetical protein
MKFIREQETTQREIDLCTEQIRQSVNEINKIVETYFRISTRLLVIDNHLIQIREVNLREFDLPVLNQVYRTFDCPIGSYTALASNDQFLLIHQNPNLCLVEKEANIVKQVPWTHDVILNMCWSSTLNRFIIVEENAVFLVDEKIMSIEILETNDKRKWISCVYNVFFGFPGKPIKPSYERYRRYRRYRRGYCL